MQGCWTRVLATRAGAKLTPLRRFPYGRPGKRSGRSLAMHGAAGWQLWPRNMISLSKFGRPAVRKQFKQQKLSVRFCTPTPLALDIPGHCPLPFSALIGARIVRRRPSRVSWAFRSRKKGSPFPRFLDLSKQQEGKSVVCSETPQSNNKKPLVLALHPPLACGYSLVLSCCLAVSHMALSSSSSSSCLPCTLR